MRKNNKGFTLIELLAIIVILAIIAVITVPIILNVIDNAKKGTVKDSAYGYKDAISKFYISKMQDDTKYGLSGTFTTEKLKLDGLSVSGHYPTSGWVKVEKGEVLEFSLKFDDYIVNYDSITKNMIVNLGGNVKENSDVLNKKYFTGDAIENYGGYNWHVINDDGIYLTLLMDDGQIDDMKHCDNNSTCQKSDSGEYIYTWSESLINKYLNNEIYEEIYKKIGNVIVSEKVCNDPTIYDATAYSYGGFLESEIVAINKQGGNAVCLTGYNESNIRLISITEFFNMDLNRSNLYGVTHGITSLYMGPTDIGNIGYIPNLDSVTSVDTTSWLYSFSIDTWWTMTSYSGNNCTGKTNMARAIYRDGRAGSCYGVNSSFAVRPVIKIKK